MMKLSRAAQSYRDVYGCSQLGVKDFVKTSWGPVGPGVHRRAFFLSGRKSLWHEHLLVFAASKAHVCNLQRPTAGNVSDRAAPLGTAEEREGCWGAKGQKPLQRRHEAECCQTLGPGAPVARHSAGVQASDRTWCGKTKTLVA